MTSAPTNQNIKQDTTSLDKDMCAEGNECTQSDPSFSSSSIPSPSSYATPSSNSCSLFTNICSTSLSVEEKKQANKQRKHSFHRDGHQSHFELDPTQMVCITENIRYEVMSRWSWIRSLHWTDVVRLVSDDNEIHSPNQSQHSTRMLFLFGRSESISMKQLIKVGVKTVVVHHVPSDQSPPHISSLTFTLSFLQSSTVDLSLYPPFQFKCKLTPAGELNFQLIYPITMTDSSDVCAYLSCSLSPPTELTGRSSTRWHVKRLVIHPVDSCVYDHNAETKEHSLIELSNDAQKIYFLSPRDKHNHKVIEDIYKEV